MEGPSEAVIARGIPARREQPVNSSRQHVGSNGGSATCPTFTPLRLGRSLGGRTLDGGLRLAVVQLLRCLFAFERLREHVRLHLVFDVRGLERRDHRGHVILIVAALARSPQVGQLFRNDCRLALRQSWRMEGRA